MNLNSKLQQQELLNKKLQRLLASSIEQISELKTSTDSAIKVADDAIKPAALSSGLSSKANLVHTHSVSDITGLAGIATTGISTAQSFITSTINLTNAYTWYTITSLTLASGTWLLLSNILCQRAGTSTRAFSIRLTDGTTTYASGSQGMASATGNATQISCSVVITLTASTTITVQAATNTTGTPADYVGNVDAVQGVANTSGLVAVRIA